MNFKCFFLFSILICLKYNAIGQEITQSISCGDIIEGEFTKIEEWQAFDINLEPGDKLNVKVSPKFGDYLHFRINITGPSGNILFNGGTKVKKIFTAQTGIVSARGVYRVFIVNYPDNYKRRELSRLGNYILEITCDKSNGDIISPSNTKKQNEQTIDISKDQYFHVKLNTPLEGSVNYDANQNFGFKTRIKENEDTELKLSIVKGNIPIEIQIINIGNNDIVFYSSLGYSSEIISQIKFDRDGE